MQHIMIKQIYLFPLMSVLLLLGSAQMGMAIGDQNGDPQQRESLFDQLAHEDILEVNLEMDLEKITNRRSDEKYAAVFSFVDEQGVEQAWNMNVKVRGKFRRTKCTAMPPLKLDFKKKDLVAAGLAEFDDMKLVTYCVEDETLAKQLLLKEFLAYKLYNQISEESFRVQLLKINYIDSQTGDQKRQYGFVIEDTAELRARLGYEKWENPLGIAAEKIAADNLKKVALFEAMIGNTDWNAEKVHNVKVMNKAGKAIFVPYDFDFSGIVKAPYVTLNSDLGQSTLDERFYLADPADLDDMETIFSLFEEKQSILVQTIKDLKGLSFDSKRESIRYINDFFKEDRELKLPPSKKETEPLN